MEPWLDRAAARRGFETASGPDVLAQEVEKRLVERLQYIKLEAQRVIDVGCGTSSAALRLRDRYPEAAVYGVDSSFNALRRARAPANWLGRLRGILNPQRQHWIAADMAHLPFTPGSFDLLWSNLSLAWVDDPLSCFKEWQRLLRVGGLLMFTTYGPDTLKELRAAFGDDRFPHVHPFIDMHDLGDMMVASGFAEPVMDMEMLTLTYGDVPAMLGDLRDSGQANAHHGRRRALTGKDRWQQMTKRYAAMAREGRIPATFEIVYGHAWKPAPREIADGRRIIEFKTRPGHHE